ncbi:MAG: precorrin-8X methylmutase [Lachnospiraceae bacterium]|nr:precorrin-8X methylmutase [Lachnospiraceae bacterium]
MIENIRPEEIERRSFEIIEEELKARSISVPSQYDTASDEERELCRSIVYRCIHTTADFDYARTLRFSDNAIDIIKKLLCEGADIVTDTNMALAGINKKKLESHGGQVHCFMADEDVAKEAQERGLTRAYVAMEKAMSLYEANPEKPMIFAIGNAPTALISLYDIYSKGLFKPDFIIGAPVGFVNVVHSKELIMKTDIPYIINEGNKGGSPVAAAIVNALLYFL